MKRILILFSTFMITGIPGRAEPLTIGTPAPAPSALNQDNVSVNLADVYARGLTLVYFYPKADTPGCTAQACSLRDAYAGLTGEGLQIVGVSKDTPEAQKAFKEKYNLPFVLLADTDGKVSEAFGVGSATSRRQSFLVKDGKIAWTALKAQTSGHAAEVQTAIDSLQ